jgi:hypothetical protein
LSCSASSSSSGASPAAWPRAALWFLPGWLLVAAINMWIGVSRAGYSVAAEAPIFLVVFAVPAAVALLARRMLARP